MGFAAFLFCAIFSVPVTGIVILPAYLPLYQAADAFSAGEDAKAAALLEPLLAPASGDGAENGDDGPSRAARMLLAVHHACAGRISQAGTFWNALSEEERRRTALSFIGRRLLALRTVPDSASPSVWIHADGMLGMYRNCRPEGILFLADFLYEVSSPDIRKALFEWLPSQMPVDAAPDARTFRGIVSYFALVNRRLRHHWISEPLSDVEIEALDAWMKKLNRTHPLDSGTPWRIGALLPLTGAWSALGMSMLAALSAAQEQMPGLEIVVHDTRSSPDTAVWLLGSEVLLRDRPLAVLLPPDPESQKALLAAGAEDVTFLGVTDAPEGLAVPAHAFFAGSSRRARVEALAARAVAEKAMRVGILAPDTPAGRELAGAARAVLERAHASVVFSVTYDPAKLPPALSIPELKNAQAVIIPDSAERVAALARRLAAAGAFPAPLDAKGRGFLLLATAEALSPAVVAGNARYFSGAIFAPGFYSGVPDAEFNALVASLTRAGIASVLEAAAETYLWVRQLAPSAVLSRGVPALLRREIAAWSQGPGMGKVFGPDRRSQRPVRLYRFLSGRMTKLP